jgi:hypothetical protein
LSEAARRRPHENLLDKNANILQSWESAHAVFCRTIFRHGEPFSGFGPGSFGRKKETKAIELAKPFSVLLQHAPFLPLTCLARIYI